MKRLSFVSGCAIAAMLIVGCAGDASAPSSAASAITGEKTVGEAGRVLMKVSIKSVQFFDADLISSPPQVNGKLVFGNYPADPSQQCTPVDFTSAGAVRSGVFLELADVERPIGLAAGFEAKTAAGAAIDNYVVSQFYDMPPSWILGKTYYAVLNSSTDGITEGNTPVHRAQITFALTPMATDSSPPCSKEIIEEPAPDTTPPESPYEACLKFVRKMHPCDYAHLTASMVRSCESQQELACKLSSLPVPRR